MLRDKRLLRRLRIFYRREESEYQMMGGPQWAEDHWCFNWFPRGRALWAMRKTHALDGDKPTWVIKWSLHGHWTITWNRDYNL